MTPPARPPLGLVQRLAALALAFAPVVAHAGEDRPAPAATATGTAPLEQPFLYLADPHGPAPRQVLAGYALAFSSSPGAIRPIPGHFDQEGVVHQLGLEAGVLPRLSIWGSTQIAEAIGKSDVGAVAVQAGARVLVTPPAWQRFRLVVQAGFLREFGAALGIAGEVTASYDLGRVRLAGAVHAERLFAPDRDPIDLYAVAGASVRVMRLLRVGLEYVAQDLEAAVEDDEAEGGARHFVGPDVALALLGHRLLVTAGAAVQLARAPGVLARGALTYVY